MKIESASVQASTTVNTTAVKSSPKSNQIRKPENESRSNKQLSQRRISKWFSQVGVQSAYSDIKSPTLEDKVRLKETILAQRKLKNLENILGRALDFCLDEGKEEELDPDWFFSFINMAEEIHSVDMQELWGKIFAVETARPGSFSLNTLRILKQLTQKDAQIFRHAVNLTSRRKGESTPKLLLGYYQKTNLWSLFSSHKEHQVNLAEFGLSYPDVLLLMDLGLIHHSEIESGELPIGQAVEWRCAGQVINFKAKKAGTTLVYYKFTPTGAELCKLVSRQKQDLYVGALRDALNSCFEIA